MQAFRFRTRTFLLSIVVLAPMLALEGIRYRKTSQENRRSHQVLSVLKRLNEVPRETQSWVQTGPFQMNQVRDGSSNIASVLNTQFANKKFGDTITVSVVFGSPKYAARSLQDRSRGKFSNQPNMQTIKVIPKDTLPIELQCIESKTVKFGWTSTANGFWTTPAVPQTFYQNEDFVCRVYFEQEINGTHDEDDDPFEQFVSEFLPLMSKQLYQVGGKLSPNGS